MKKFIRKSSPYVLIGIIYLLIGESYLSIFKENTPITEVASIQATNNQELYYSRRLFKNLLTTYKYECLQNKQPKVLIVGQSVVLQFRDFMFHPFEKGFYNTGLMARNVKDLEYLLHQFTNGTIKQPEIVVLGLDFTFVLQTNELDRKEWIKDRPEDHIYKTKAHFNAFQKIFLNENMRKIPEENYGFGKAGMIGRGYRNDGSHRHKPEIEQYIFDSSNYDSKLREDLKNRVHPFCEPIAFDSTKGATLKRVLEQYKENGISLLLYFPPFSDQFFNTATQDRSFNRLWKKYIAYQNMLISEGYDVISFTTPSQIDLNDDYMIDAGHPSEVICGIQLYNYLRSTNVRDKRLTSIDTENLRLLINDKQTMPKSFLKDEISASLIAKKK